MVGLSPLRQITNWQAHAVECIQKHPNLKPLPLSKWKLSSDGLKLCYTNKNLLEIIMANSLNAQVQQAILDENLQILLSALQTAYGKENITVEVLSKALVEAARNNKIRSLEFLIKAGADVNYNDSEAIYQADTRGHRLTVTKLLDAGASPEGTISGVLEKSAREGDEEGFKAAQPHYSPLHVNLGFRTGTTFNQDGSISFLGSLDNVPSRDIDVFSLHFGATPNQVGKALDNAANLVSSFSIPKNQMIEENGSSMDIPASPVLLKTETPPNDSSEKPFWEKSIAETMMANAKPLPKAADHALHDKNVDPFEGLTKQGFRVIKHEADDIPGREDEVTRTLGLLNKGKSVVLTGRSGSGKSTLAQSLGERLSREDKILMEVPVSAFRSSDSYVEGAHRAVKAWFGAYDQLPKELQNKLVFFVDEAQQLVGNSDGGVADSPMGFLKTRLDPKHPNKMVLLGATTRKNYEDVSDRDETFARYFTEIELSPMSAEQAIDGLLRPASLKDLKFQGLDIGEEKQFRQLLGELSTLADQFIPNQDFPRKLSDLTQEMLAQKPTAEWHLEGEIAIQNGFCKIRQIPNSMVLNKTPADSPYLTITTDLNEDVLGQKESITKVSSLALSSICRQGGTHAPKSAMLMGSTGVGKTETAESLARRLGIPFLKLHMGSQTNQIDAKQLLEDLAYFAENNYAGLILLDELEKADPKSFEALLGFLDKGEISGGKNGMVKTGNMIVLMTTNAGADILHEVGEEMNASFQTRDVPERICREILKDFGFAPEFVGRVDAVAEYHPLSHEVALKLATRSMMKEQRIWQQGRGVELNMGEALLSQLADKGLALHEGGRGIQRVVKETLAKSITLPGIAQNLDQGASLRLDLNEQEEMTVSLKNKDNVSIEIKGGAHKAAENEAYGVFQNVLKKRREEGKTSPTLFNRRGMSSF